MSTDDEHKVYFSGEEDMEEKEGKPSETDSLNFKISSMEYGLGFLVHKDMVTVVLGYRPVSSRLIISASHRLCANIWA